MTYSSDLVAHGQHFDQLLDTLQRDLDELRRMASVYDDATTMPGRRPDVDADGTGRQAQHGPSRPTERMALDVGREALQRELKNGVRHVSSAIAFVRGVTASMDRALIFWEGEDEVHIPGG
ncbi:DUF7169 domain-containing protein [Streptomyces chryseus]|uniref:DUF7169 domain-containing protein n=1 Tax=Streptomyces chryseus TaxID=68186 RepID=UPI00110FB916|nr:hypothetical protein [Streptomyces chryseus]GGX26658.1 hypothetical protein GCM10010353_47150 [Streptomyces chryseus]